MNKFRVIPLSKDYAAKLRDSRIDDFGHSILEETATGLGPCRVSLQPFTRGKDKRLLLSHSPFTIDNAFNQPGPVFIAAEEVEPYADVYRFPPAIKENPSFHLTLIGYSPDQRMVHTELVQNNLEIEEQINLIFEEHTQIDFLHVRSAVACCYICTIVRA